MNQPPSQASVCPHVCHLGDYTKDDILKKQQAAKCDSCDARGLNLWVCLYRDCLYVGCGESVVDHSTRHFSENTDHCLTLNLTTFRVWCYLCECEVFVENNEPPVRGTMKRIPVTNVYVADADTEDEDETDDQNLKPRGLTGLQNIGNTCYMNAAIQALSNCPPLTQFFLDCSAFVRNEKRPGLSKSFTKLMMEMWHKKRPSYVVPSSISYGIKMVCPMFRGYTQQDSQEFLRCFMDQLHEELKEPLVEIDPDLLRPNETPMEGVESDDSSQSEAEYETCDSGLSSEKSSYSDEGADSNDISMIGCSLRGEKLRNKGINRGVGGNRDGTALERLKEPNGLRLSDSGIRFSIDDIPAHDMEVDRFSDAMSDPSPTTDKEKTNRSISPPTLEGIKSMRSAPDVSGKTTTGNLSPLQSKSISKETQKANKKKRQIKYRSIISDVFDGKILSSVQCLTCDRISTTKETFQDLSLPIPSREYLGMLHASQTNSQKGALSTCTDVYNNQGWISWMFGWMKSWIWGPTVSLQDCLAAFFSADELKGDNMYSCEKCKKLRNGIKYSKVLELPEILCIHLKRFRHEVMFSSKISSYVSFPLEGLDMKPFLHKDCAAQVTAYDLVAVICHHGTAGGGHYTTYALNWINDQWYEFDDQYVTEIDPQVIAGCEAYVLFYRKSCEEISRKRVRTLELIEISKKESSLMQFYISKQWINKFNTFAEPGPINNTDFLCPHGGVPPAKATYVEDLCTALAQGVWEYLHNSYGGGPVCNHLYICPTCQQELENLERRQKQELDTFIKLNKEFQSEDCPGVIYAINMSWFRLWENFAKGKENEPPGPIDNYGIAQSKNGQVVLKIGSDYAQFSEAMWQFLHSVYSGGPELVLRHSSGSQESHSVGSVHLNPCSVHTAGKVSQGSVPVKTEHETIEMLEYEKGAAGDAPCEGADNSPIETVADAKTPSSSENQLKLIERL